MDNSVYKYRKVELYRDGVKKIDLKYSDTLGSYFIKDSLENGEYDIYVDEGKSGAKLMSSSKKTISDLSPDDLSARHTGDTFNLSVNLTNLNIMTYLDGVPYNVGDISCVDKDKHVLKTTYIDDENKVAVYDSDKRKRIYC